MLSFLYTYLIILAWIIIASLSSFAAYRFTPKTVRAPYLDLVISSLTWVPWVIGIFLDGIIGLIAACLAQYIGIHLFSLIDRAVRGKPKQTLTEAQGKILGPIRNHIALIATTPATVTFIFVRFTELFIYPPIAVLAKLPQYKQSDWVNLSRHKFEGLTGPDLLWCWYCDWMTGLWALGSDMLRNIESFWCPIRFDDSLKNQHSKLDFPDVEDWTPADGTMDDVVANFEKHYQKDGVNSWWSHPDRRKE